MKKINLLFVLVLIASLVLPTTVFAGQEKVSVCHIDSTYDFGGGSQAVGHVISIADPAYDSHVAHGDPAIYIEATLPDGSSACVPDNDGDGLPDYQDLCYTNGVRSFSLNGPLGGRTNTDYRDLTDCTGASFRFGAVYATFAAPDSDSAWAMCASYAGGLEIFSADFFNWSARGYDASADWWYCNLDVDSPV